MKSRETTPIPEDSTLRIILKWKTRHDSDSSDQGKDSIIIIQEIKSMQLMVIESPRVISSENRLSEGK